MNKRNYELTLNVTTGKIKIPSINIYNTDKGIFNIKLFLEKGEGKNIAKLTHDEMVNYKALFQAVKSKTKNYVELEGVLDETENFFYYDLGSKFNDQVGVYNCQIFITDTKGTNDNTTDDEVVTSVPFNYTVTASILTGLNAEVTANPDLPVLKELINECKILMNLDSADMSVLDPFQKKEDNAIDGADKNIISNINSINSQIKDIEKRIKYVTYDMFGAKSDGIYDDGISIKLAHDYANEHNLPVKQTSGEYWIKNTWDIEVKTSTDLGSSVFHIKEREKQGYNLYKIVSNNTHYDMRTDDLTNLNGKLKKGTLLLNELSNYENHFITVQDDNTNWTQRYGGEHIKLKDNLMIGQGGLIVGGVARDILTPTKAVCIKLDDDFLYFKGGVFKIDSDYQETGYVNGIIRCFRSKTKFENNTFYVSNINGSIAINGLINVTGCCEITINNPIIPSRVDTPLSGGTYGLTLYDCVQVKLYNFNNFSTSQSYWGVTGCNFVKNLFVKDSYLNRLDCHCGAYNIYLDNVNITYYGVTLTGGGDLHLLNSKFTRQMINLRDDFGSRWDGLIKIHNCDYYIIDNSIPKIIAHDNTIAGHDFIYDTMMCTSLIVDGLTFDYKNYITNSHDVNLLLFQKKNFNYKLPYDATFNNIKVRGRESNIKLMYVDKPHEQEAFFKFDYHPKNDLGAPIKDEFIEHLLCNCDIVFNNISTKKLVKQNAYGDAHIIFNNCNGDNNYIELGFAPKISIKNCDNLCVKINGGICDLNIFESTVNTFNNYSNGTRSRATLTNSKIQANVQNDIDVALKLTSDNITLNNCIILPKFVNNVLTNNLTSYDFLSGLSLKCLSNGSCLSKSFKSIENYQAINYLLNGGKNIAVYPSQANDLGTLRNEYNNLIQQLKDIGIIKN